MRTPRGIDIRVASHAGMSVVTVVGVLDLGSCAKLRNRLLKAAAEEPRAVVVDVGELAVPAPASLSVFSAVWLRVAEWPGVPVLLLAEDPARHAELASRPVARYVPVHRSLASALASLHAPAARWRDQITLPRKASSSAAARRFVKATCRRWGLDALIESAAAVATELVENALRHTTSGAGLRMDLRRGLLSVSVSDGSTRPAVLREAASNGLPSAGLGIVANLSRAWGCVPTTGGKVVWAVLRAPERRD